LFEFITDIFSVDFRGEYTEAIEKLEDVQELTNSYLGVIGNFFYFIPPFGWLLLLFVIVYCCCFLLIIIIREMTLHSFYRTCEDNKIVWAVNHAYDFVVFNKF